MEIVRINQNEYFQSFSEPYHIFNSVPFSELNKEKVEDLFYLIFRDPKIRLGIILGKRENILFSPFSAPFGGFTFNKHDISIYQIDTALELLVRYATENDYHIKISLPPSVYHTDFISKQISSFFRSNFSLLYCDVNYSFDLQAIGEYSSNLWRNARKNLNNSFTHNFNFQKAESEKDIAHAYSVIQANREGKGYPLRMSFEAVKETIKIVKADFFNLYLEEESIAAAQIFHVSTDIVQVIYWGDKPGFENMRPMNFLSFKVWEYYKNKGLKHIDIGPSSENGTPNYGLCEFKESIGCSVTNKMTFFYENK